MSFNPGGGGGGGSLAGDSDVTLNSPADGHVLAYDSGTSKWQNEQLTAADVGAVATNALFLNVKDFGAVGDGVTDDSVAIQAAINQALTNGGGTIYAPPATYVVKNLTLGSNITFKGAGIGSTILLMFPNAPADTWVIRATNSNAGSFITMSDFTVDGNMSTVVSPTGKYYGVYGGSSTMGQVTDLVLERIEVKNVLTYAYDLIRLTRTTITGCLSHDNGISPGSTWGYSSGFEILSDDTTLVNCKSWNNGNNGLSSGQSSTVYYRTKVIGCSFYNNQGDGVYFYGALQDSQVIGCAIQGNAGNGVHLSSVNHAAITGNSITANANAGISFSGTTNTTVIGNVIELNGTVSPADADIYMYGTSTNNQIIGNQINTGNHSPASIVEHTSTDDYNTFRANVINSGLTITGTHSTVSDARYLGAWQASTKYYLNDIVTNGGNLYVAPGNFTSGTTFNATNWTQIGITVGGGGSDGSLSSAIPQADAVMAAAGSTGFGSDAGHAHPRTIWAPTDHSLISWSFDPAVVGGSSTALATAGTMYVIKLHNPVASNITNILAYVVTAGAGLTSGQCFAALYQGGNLLGTTADQSTAWASTGLKIMALTGAPIATTAGDVYVALWFNGATGPALTRSGGVSVVNVGLSGATSRFGAANTGITTAAPGTLGTISAYNVAFWIALS